MTRSLCLWAALQERATAMDVTTRVIGTVVPKGLLDDHWRSRQQDILPSVCCWRTLLSKSDGPKYTTPSIVIPLKPATQGQGRIIVCGLYWNIYNTHQKMIYRWNVPRTVIWKGRGLRNNIRADIHRGIAMGVQMSSLIQAPVSFKLLLWIFILYY